jgi:hypothetical protein
MRTFRRVCGEVDTASMPAKMRRMAPAGHKSHGEASAGTRRTAGGTAPAGRRWLPRGPEALGRLLRSGALDPRMEYEDSIPMERRPTLPVTEILAA